MYRTGDPRFRRRLDEIGQTLESAQESAQTSIFQGYQTYIKPCFQSIGQTVSSCVEASCPTLNLTADQRERLRRQQRQGRSRGRAELNFDFYDDWEEDDTDALMGWGNNDEFDRLLAGSAGYGTVATQNTAAQPARQRGMSYPKARRKSAADTAQDPTVIPGSSLFGKLFGGKALRYKPSAADLQDHPGVARHDLTEGEALLRESEGRRRKHRRDRSGTVASGHTTDSLSSRGDIFPSDGEDDAIPLDDEFAMVLERRVAGMETDTSSGRTRSTGGKRPSAGSRNSTFSSRRRADSSAAQSPVQERMPEVPSLSEMKEEERVAEREEEEEVARKRAEARRLAIEQEAIALSDHEREDGS
ncbi:hypothetical protein BDY17DRAFT_318223 [Neohortaea acidophila]|uniref:Uncharacterized protein n=1 Tax=Neohortaea acidophila TaxID=245834 RepID=A0A6A6PL67_9PEZI|nr:uncharacterized protein BDY17DRAFT_318223 [Neohortaea acidophila]KAF2480546.1 hypothetical protein BDY17DRAFT_318223 [Neohortaea acidophila]